MVYDNSYGSPILRYGRICTLIDISYEETNSIADLLVKDAENLRVSLKTRSKEFGYEKVQATNQRCRIQHREGPIVLYPRIRVFFDSIEAEAGASVTVCKEPRHSKIWLRLSYSQNGKENSHSQLLNMEDVENFFESAEPVSDKSTGMWLKTYNHVLHEKKYETVKGIHTIIIQTVAANLGVIAEKLESRSFNMADIFNGSDDYSTLRGLLYLTYEEDVPNLERYEQLSNDKYQWITMSIHGKENMVGLYSKHDEGKQTKIVGLVHEPSNDPSNLRKQAREFSARLVEEIGPMI